MSEIQRQRWVLHCWWRLPDGTDHTHPPDEHIYPSRDAAVRRWRVLRDQPQTIAPSDAVFVSVGPVYHDVDKGSGWEPAGVPAPEVVVVEKRESHDTEAAA